jgi:ATP-binding cassette subfamily F protein 3
MAIVLQLQGVSKSFGLRLLFDDVTLSIAEGQKIGFVGANGSGKTTLLKFITGDDVPETGEVVKHPNLRLGYLEQNEQFPAGETSLAYLERISGRESWECAKMAGAFDIKHELLEKPFLTLSGGYQMRVRLAGILVRDPNLLVLDEPTNYLDLQTVLLLEEVLRKFRGALLLVSHDREFLKNVCTHTLELEHKKLTLFFGNIEAYLAEKEEKLKEALRYNKKVESKRAHLQAFVDRFRYKASLAAQAQNKIKQIERLETIEIAHSIRTVRITIPCPPQKKAIALTCKELSVGYVEGKPILNDVNLEIMCGEHVAVLGENGQGKSTFLKTIVGELSALSGTHRWGHNLRVAYYAQHVPLMLPKYGTVGTVLASAGGAALPEDLLRMAGNFLFSQDDLDKPVSILSGGEKARLCLASICLGRFDILVLDEPTNHLDFDTVEALGEALQEYGGTIFFVSHDRTFVSEIATAILDVENGKIRRYAYPYDIYVYEKKTHQTFAAPEEVAVPGMDGSVPYIRSRSDIHHDIQKEKRAMKRLEVEMDELTQEKQKLYNAFLSNPTKPDVERSKRLKQIDEELIQLESDWFSAQERADSAQKELDFSNR